MPKYTQRELDIPPNVDSEYLLKTDWQTIYYMAEKIHGTSGKSGGDRFFVSRQAAMKWLGGKPGQITDKCSVLRGAPRPSDNSETEIVNS